MIMLMMKMIVMIFYSRSLKTKPGCHGARAYNGDDNDDGNGDVDDDTDDDVTEDKARLPWSKSRQWWQPRTTSGDQLLLKHTYVQVRPYSVNFICVYVFLHLVSFFVFCSVPVFPCALCRMATCFYFKCFCLFVVFFLSSRFSAFSLQICAHLAGVATRANWCLCRTL